jgi:hypothetical protein
MHLFTYNNHVKYCLGDFSFFLLYLLSCFFFANAISLIYAISLINALSLWKIKNHCVTNFWFYLSLLIRSSLYPKFAYKIVVFPLAVDYCTFCTVVGALAMHQIIRKLSSESVTVAQIESTNTLFVLKIEWVHISKRERKIYRVHHQQSRPHIWPSIHPDYQNWCSQTPAAAKTLSYRQAPHYIQCPYH